MVNAYVTQEAIIFIQGLLPIATQYVGTHYLWALSYAMMAILLMGMGAVQAAQQSQDINAHI